MVRTKKMPKKSSVNSRKLRGGSKPTGLTIKIPGRVQRSPVLSAIQALAPSEQRIVPSAPPRTKNKSRAVNFPPTPKLTSVQSIPHREDEVQYSSPEAFPNTAAATMSGSGRRRPMKYAGAPVYKAYKASMAPRDDVMSSEQLRQQKAIRARIAAEQAIHDNDLQRHIARTIQTVASRNATVPYMYTVPSLASPVTQPIALQALHLAALEKASPSPDPRMERVSAPFGVYRVPGPDSLPIGARFIPPVSATVPLKISGLTEMEQVRV